MIPDTSGLLQQIQALCHCKWSVNRHETYHTDVQGEDGHYFCLHSASEATDVFDSEGSLPLDEVKVSLRPPKAEFDPVGKEANPHNVVC